MQGGRRFRRERIYIVPTMFGVGVGFLLLVFTVSATTLGAKVAIVFGLTLLLAFLLAMLQTNTNMSGLTITAVGAEPTAADSEIVLRVTVRNHSSRPKFMIEVAAGAGFFRGASEFALIERLDAHATTEAEVRLPALSRGIHGAPRLRIASRFPLGVCYAWKLEHPKAELVVYPAPAGRSDWPRDANAANDKGRSRVIAQGDGDFWGHRTYAPGDHMAHVDWKIKARGRGLHVKKFAYGESVTHNFRYQDLDLVGHELRLQQLSLWALRAAEEGHAFGLDLPHGKKIAIANGHGHVTKALRLLAEAEA